VVFQSGAPKAFGAYKMLLRSTNLSYGGFVCYQEAKIQ
jgi:hypothetical protein